MDYGKELDIRNRRKRDKKYLEEHEKERIRIKKRKAQQKANYINNIEPKKFKNNAGYEYTDYFRDYAKANHGLLNLSLIERAFSSTMMTTNDDGTINLSKYFLDWIEFENKYDKYPFITGYDKYHPNVSAIASAILSGFLDADDIKNDLHISLKQARRIMRPINDYLNHGKVVRSFNNHIIIDNLVRVHDTSQYIKSKNKIKAYGTNPNGEIVVSTVAYLGFLINMYKGNRMNNKYISRHFNYWGQLVNKSFDELPKQKLKKHYLSAIATVRLQKMTLKKYGEIVQLLTKILDNHNVKTDNNTFDKFHYLNVNIHKNLNTLHTVNGALSKLFETPIVTKTKSKLISRYNKHYKLLRMFNNNQEQRLTLIKDLIR